MLIFIKSTPILMDLLGEDDLMRNNLLCDYTTDLRKKCPLFNSKHNEKIHFTKWALLNYRVKRSKQVGGIHDMFYTIWLIASFYRWQMLTAETNVPPLHSMPLKSIINVLFGCFILSLSFVSKMLFFFVRAIRAICHWLIFPSSLKQCIVWERGLI